MQDLEPWNTRVRAHLLLHLGGEGQEKRTMASLLELDLGEIHGGHVTPWQWQLDLLLHRVLLRSSTGKQYVSWPGQKDEIRHILEKATS